jgi:hypothetical protein
MSKFQSNHRAFATSDYLARPNVLDTPRAYVDANVSWLRAVLRFVGLSAY